MALTGLCSAMIWPLYVVAVVAVTVRPRVVISKALLFLRSRRIREILTGVGQPGSLDRTKPLCIPILRQSLTPSQYVDLGCAIEKYFSARLRSRKQQKAKASISAILTCKGPRKTVSVDDINDDVIEQIVVAVQRRGQRSIMLLTTLSRIVRPASWAGLIWSVLRATSALLRQPTSASLVHLAVVRLRRIWLGFGYYIAVHIAAAPFLCDDSTGVDSVRAITGCGFAWLLMIVEELFGSREDRDQRRQHFTSVPEALYPQHRAEGYNRNRVISSLRARRWRRGRISLFLTFASSYGAVTSRSRLLGTVACASMFVALWPADYAPYVFDATHPSSARLLVPSMSIWVLKVVLRRGQQYVRRCNAFIAQFAVFDIGLSIFGSIALNVTCGCLIGTNPSIVALTFSQVMLAIVLRDDELFATSMGMILPISVHKVLAQRDLSRVAGFAFAVLTSSALSSDMTCCRFFRHLQAIYLIDR